MHNMYMQRNKDHINDKMQWLQIDKYEHKHDGGSKKKNYIQISSHKLFNLGYCHSLFYLRKE
jgi:hypothetical protein